MAETKDTGYQFDTDARMQVYLTNTLEEPGNSDAQLTLFDDPLAFESISANAVKENSGINVVIGNPPYSISSSNKGEWILSLLSDYKQGLNERKVNLDDDYIKFIRYGQYVINQAGSGILAYISNNSFLDGTTHRKMRYDLLREFNRIIIINLHGNSKRFEKAPDGSKDENVFDLHIEKENSLNITYQGQGDNLIDGIKYKDGNVYINRAQFFTGISVDLWEQKVVGYAPLQKWLKLRNGRHLSEDEILSYITTVNAIFRTNKIMEQIDSFLSL